MTMFDDRERAHEAKFAHDQEMAFLVIARRNRLLGQWASVRMELSPEASEDYARSVIHAEFEELRDEDVVRKLLADLTAAGIDTSEAEIREALSEKSAEAHRQLMETQ